MSSKLSLHISRFDGNIFDYLERMQPSIVKVLDFPSEANIDEIRRRAPGTLIVYRQFTNLSYNDSADAYVAELNPTLAKLSGRGIVWEGINEPVLNSAQEAQKLDAWFVRFADLMHARGERVAAFSFSTGNPNLTYVPSLAASATACDFIALHEYRHPNFGSGDLTRYRSFRAQLPITARKPILITECGVDDGNNNGWQTYNTPDQYMQILADYDQQMLQDAYLIGATIFQYGDDISWRSFNVASIGNRIAQYVFDHGGGAPMPSGNIELTDVSFSPLVVRAGNFITASFTVRNTTGTAIATQGPNPGFTYNEGDTFDSRGFPTVANAFRVGVDFDGSAGIDHPYRWGLGSPLAAGETRTITGTIKLTQIQSRRFWGGLVQEHVAWTQDKIGKQLITVTPPVSITNVAFTPTAINAGDLLNVSITVRNDGTTALATQSPDPGFVYNEGDTFSSRGFADVANAFRVGIDFDGRTGVDHPLRWGLGSSLAAGETRTITGSIRLLTPRAINYWAGLVQERVAWIQDRQGTQAITVRPVSVTNVRLVSASFAPTTLNSGDYLIASFTVRNDGATTVETQGPNPSFIYQEGDTFASRGFDSVSGKFRVGIDFGGRVGADHPFRWGLGSSLAPGETRTITGIIQLKTAQTKTFWAGLVQEYVAWHQDNTAPTAITVVPSVRIVSASFAPDSLSVGNVITVSVTIKNDGTMPIETQSPDPGFVYNESDSFVSRGFPAISGKYRIGVDFDGRTGVDHPFRWGLGSSLAPGETRTITGTIRLTTIAMRDFWVGLVQELIAWRQDREGRHYITVM
jgi:hypothetical protein